MAAIAKIAGEVASGMANSKVVQESFKQLKTGFLYGVKKHMDYLKDNGHEGVKRQIFGGSLAWLGGLGIAMQLMAKAGILAAIGLGGIAAPAIPIAGLVLTFFVGLGIIYYGYHAEKRSRDVHFTESLKTALLGGIAKIYSFIKPNWEKEVESQNAIAMIKNSLSSLKNLTADDIKEKIKGKFELHSESINLFDCLKKLSKNDKNQEFIQKTINTVETNLKANLKKSNFPDSLLPAPNKSIEQQIQDYKNTLSTIKELSQDPKKILEKLDLSKDWLNIETLKNVSSEDLAGKVEALTKNIDLAKSIKESFNIEGLQNLDLSPFFQLKLDEIKAYESILNKLREGLEGLEQFSFSTFQNALKHLENSTINELAVETVVNKLLSLESKDKASYQKIIQNALKQLENRTTNKLAVETVVDKLLSLESKDKASYQAIIQDALKQLENRTTKDGAVKTVLDKLLSLESNDKASYQAIIQDVLKQLKNSTTRDVAAETVLKKLLSLDASYIEKIKTINDRVTKYPGLSEITLENLTNLSANLSTNLSAKLSGQTVFSALQELKNVMPPGSTSLTLNKINDLIEQEESWKKAIAFLTQANLESTLQQTLQKLAYVPLQAFVTAELQPIQAIIKEMSGKELLNDDVINTINSIISEDTINGLIANVVQSETTLNLDEIDLNKIKEGMQKIINQQITSIEGSLKRKVVEQTDQAVGQLTGKILKQDPKQ